MALFTLRMNPNVSRHLLDCSTTIAISTIHRDSSLLLLLLTYYRYKVSRPVCMTDLLNYLKILMDNPSVEHRTRSQSIVIISPMSPSRNARVIFNSIPTGMCSAPEPYY